MRTVGRRLLGAVVAGALALLGLSTCRTSRPASALDAAHDLEPDLRVATFNLNFGLAGDPETLEALEALDVDILLLQETNDVWEASVAERLRDRFPHQRWHPATDYPAGGSAILSRYPLRALTVSPSAAGWFAALATVVDTPRGPVQLLDVHLKPSVSASGSVVSGYFSTPPERVAEIEAHLDALDADTPTIIAGDFNEQSGGALDVLEDRGYVRPATPRTTWRWSVGPFRLHQRLDHVLHTDHLRCTHLEVRDEGRSDHLPVVAHLRFVDR